MQPNLFSIRDQRCPNHFCPFFEQKSQGNIYIHSKKKQRLQCAHCKRTWAAYSHEPFFGIRLAKEKIEQFMLLRKNKKSVRAIAQQLNMSPSTVQRWKARFKIF